MLLNINQKWKRLKKGNNNASNSDTSNSNTSDSNTSDSDASDIKVYNLIDEECYFIDRLNTSLPTHLADILYTVSDVLLI